MRQGRTLQELAAEVMRQAETKRDYLIPSRRLRLASNGQSELVLPEDNGVYRVTETCHDQLAGHLDIPGKYYDRLRREHPALLDENVNTLLDARPDLERRMVRTLDGNARAFLSDRYRRLDNYDLLQNVLPELMQSELEIRSCEVTDTRLYLKVVSPRLAGEVRVGQVVHFGLWISNSEIGGGACEVAPFSEVLTCTNGAKHTQYGKRRNHVGRAQQEGENYSLYSDETLAADDRAFWLKVRDSVRAALTETMRDRILNEMREAAGIEIEGRPEAAVEVLAQRHGLNDGEQGSVLRALIDGRDLSLWGLANAVTWTAERAPSYDRASELEALGGSLLTLPAAEIRPLVTAGR